MRVTFDDGFVPDAASGEREMLPDGVHNVTIREVKTDGAHDTVVLAPNGAYRLLYVDIKSDKKGKAKAASLASALGLSAAEWADCGPAELKGLELRVETRQWVGDDTKTRVSVDKFLPVERAAAPTPKPDRGPQTAAARVASAKGEEAGGGDDIPF
jgi:hypothetical protein